MMLHREEVSPRRKDSLSSVQLDDDPQTSSNANQQLTESQSNIKRTKSADEIKTRTIYMLQSDRNHDQFKYCSNTIKTSKYTLISFLPKNLFEQFRRYANFYFLCIAILQVVPGLSPVLPITTILPLVCVLAFTGAKDGYEDYNRHQSDKIVNNQKTLILRGGELHEESWADVRVGDVVKLTKNQACPSDLVILSTAKPQGMAYIETMSLDGETNLKTRQALEETSTLVDTAKIEEFCHHGVTVECEAPNNRLELFEGSLKFGTRIIPLTNKQVMLRGCMLRNTSWMFGLVIFTGHDTKLMQNATKTTFKRSSVERQMNSNVAFVFCIMLTVCSIATIGSAVWLSQNKNTAWYLALMDTSVGFYAFKQFWTFVILFNVLIPISLYVSVEFVKIAQKALIDMDDEMVHEPTNTRAEARTSSLSEELGQVEYVFSDKTGTLTCNVMEFLKCTIAGRAYGRATTEIGRDAAAKMGVCVPDSVDDEAKGHSSNWHFEDAEMTRDLADPRTRPAILEFLKLMALCHTVVPEYDNGELIYQASSPDEGALVEAAGHLGVKFTDRTMRTLTIDNFGREEKYELLNVLEFNSTRKRMSVVIRTPAPDSKIIIYCKGADTVVFPLLKKGGRVNYGDTTLRHLEAFAAEGLRTLVLAYAEVPENVYEAWAKRYHEATVELIDRAEKVDAVAAELERDLTLLGGTAIEDKLQRGVPDSIANLKTAGIKVWVLTGDKQETAINIGFACALLKSNMDLQVINSKDVVLDMSRMMTPAEREAERMRQTVELQAQLRGKIIEVKKGFLRDNRMSEKDVRLKEAGLVIDGHTLSLIMGDKGLEDLLLEVTDMCAAVVCCRLTPLQKATIVDLVKNNRNAITLAIGDGANDVSMITKAHIGVGISGQEGMQAVLASDYSIAQFRFLERLLLVHGRWSYYRIAAIILYSFYKNFAFCLTQFWFQLYCGFTGQTLLDSWYIGTYNMFWTSTPIMVVAIFDQDVSAASCLEFPFLYDIGPRNERFNARVLVSWLLEGVYQSFVLFAVPTYWFGGDQTLRPDGTIDGLWMMGTFVYTCTVCVVSVRVAILSSHWTFLHQLSLWFSVASYFMFLAIYSQIGGDFGSTVYGLAPRLFSTPSLLLCIIITIAICVLPTLVYQHVQKVLFPKEFHIIQEMEKFKIPFINKVGELHPMHRGRKVSRVDPSDVERLAQENSHKLESVAEPSDEEHEDDRNGQLPQDRVKVALLAIKAIKLMQNGETQVCRGFNMAQDPGEGPLIVDNERSVIFRPRPFADEESLSDQEGFHGHSSDDGDENTVWNVPDRQWYEPQSVRERAEMRAALRQSGGSNPPPLYSAGLGGRNGLGPVKESPPFAP